MHMHEQEETELYEINTDMQDDEIAFSSFQNYCVCVVDIVNSTKIILSMNNPQKVRKYILTFINSMATIARNFDATIVKTVGDAVIFYFPKTSDSDNKDSFMKVFDCFSAMQDASALINATLQKESLPPVSYRISADYGRVEVAKSTTSREDDLFGSTMILCVKINSMARRNGIVIGADLYRVAKSLQLEKDYGKFTEIGSYATGLKFSYPVYEVT
jgi:two-component system, OmpR family, response regulator ChvI